MSDLKLSSIIRKMIYESTESGTYYVPWSSWFDRNPYDIAAIYKAVKAAGGQRIRKGKERGQFNQPEVVIFNADERIVSKVIDNLKDIGIDWPMVSRKDW